MEQWNLTRKKGIKKSLRTKCGVIVSPPTAAAGAQRLNPVLQSLVEHKGDGHPAGNKKQHRPVIQETAPAASAATAAVATVARARGDVAIARVAVVVVVVVVVASVVVIAALAIGRRLVVIAAAVIVAVVGQFFILIYPRGDVQPLTIINGH